MARRKSPTILALVAALAFAAGSACDGGSQPPSSKPNSEGKPIGGAGGGKPIGGGASAGDSAGDSAGGGGGGEARTPMLAADHPQYDRREGAGFKNDCSADADCLVGGCGSEVCSADPGVMTTCELLPGEVPATAACGCVRDQCIWFTTNGQTMAPAPSSGGVVGGGGSPGAGDSGGDPGGGVQCGEAVCAKGEECIEYYGIAGPSGPKFKTCGIPCGPKKPCPAGKKCVTIADGPGNVCQ